MKRILLNILCLGLMAAGMLVLAYPAVSNLINTYRHKTEVTSYIDEVKNMSNEDALARLRDAEEFNREISVYGGYASLTSAQHETYMNLLNITSSGIMCYIKIPILEVQLPVYHGTDEGTLRAGAGHLEGTSLPVGGKGTHAVISAHTGMVDEKLFTNLDKMKKKDIFIIKVLNKTLTYEVDHITVVLPDNTEPLASDPDKDYCTLLTCTPYGVNSHRLLVRGKRIKNIEPEPNIAAINPTVIIMLIGFLLIFVLFVWYILRMIKERRRRSASSARLRQL